jgi:hypothetical protein
VASSRKKRPRSRRDPTGMATNTPVEDIGWAQGALRLRDVLEGLYESEINCTIYSMWDAGWYVALGNPQLGYDAETNVETLEEAARWLDAKARELYPESVYALGQEQCDRRQAERAKAEQGMTFPCPNCGAPMELVSAGSLNRLRVCERCKALAWDEDGRVEWRRAELVKPKD